ncbi:response regulator [Vallitalea okinawensis]|uniref:response regulator n=1 Tax=Vallitalea okinawensis TaxID=2078660 RepID=UPI000CFBB228|nr:response regulator [Vallitalea okinawensis]
MYKVLLVDDKALIRKGLQKMIDWNNLNLELIGEAENGNQALEVIKEKKPHIVITDIRMPKTDGIELLKSINHLYPEIKTIVISGYDDFQYAQQAIKNGSLDYILKPINPTELNRSIEKACILLDKNTDSERKASNYLMKLMHNTGEAVDYHADGLFEDNPDRLVFSTVAMYDKYNEINVNNIYKQLKGYSNFLHVLLIQDTNETLFIFYTEHDLKLKVFESRIYDTIERVIENNSTSHRIIFGIGQPCMGIEGIKESYKTARENMLYALLDKSITIVLNSEIVNKQSFNIPLDQYEDELLIHMTSGNVNDVKSILEKIIKRVFETKDIRMDSIRLFLTNLCHIILRVDSGLSEEIQDFLVKINNLYYFLSFEHMEMVTQMLMNLFYYTTKKYMKKNNKKDAVIDDIKEFIHKNYSNDIGLSQISELYHMNASYLSNLFKKETGENINQYITKIRIENAKKMLTAPSVNIKELAYLVGYSDYTYFYKVFKKVTGKTPKQYNLEMITK